MIYAGLTWPPKQVGKLFLGVHAQVSYDKYIYIYLYIYVYIQSIFIYMYKIKLFWFSGSQLPPRPSPIGGRRREAGAWGGIPSFVLAIDELIHIYDFSYICINV